MVPVRRIQKLNMRAAADEEDSFGECWYVNVCTCVCVCVCVCVYVCVEI